MANNTDDKKSTKLQLTNREHLELDGIEDVLSFDEMSVYLVTENGNLLVEGTDLHITTLNVELGDLVIEGYIRSMAYNDKETGKKSSFLSRVLK